MNGDDRLSGYLDGELSDDEHQRLEIELDAGPDLRAELSSAREGRDLVRSLGPVIPPGDFVFEPSSDGDEVGHDADVIPLAERRRARPWILGVAAATIFFLVLGFASGTGVADVVPPVDELIDQHAAAAEAMPDEVIDGPFVAMPMEDMDDEGPAMPDMPMVAAYQSDDITQFLYDTDHGAISVFRQDGNLVASALPGSDPVPMVSGLAMVMSGDGSDVVVVERDDVVFTVVGATAEHEMVMTMAEAVPETDRSVIDQVRRWFGRWA